MLPFPDSHFPKTAAIVLSGFLFAFGGHAQDLSHRQNALTVTVRDGSGAIIPACDVRIETVDPAFRWGTAVTASRLRAQHPETMWALNSYFNSITFENDMKWQNYGFTSDANREAYLKALDGMAGFGTTQPLRIRGHVTVWSNQAPVNFSSTSMTPAQLKTYVRDHIIEYHNDFAGRVTDFDFYNEPRNARALISKIFPSSSWADNSATSNVSQEEIDEIAGWFQLGAATDPEAVFFINDFNVINNWETDHRRVRAYKDFIDRLRDAGAPIGGIGVQCHLDRFLTVATVKARFDILAAPMAPTAKHPSGLPGLPIEITELDINGPSYYFSGTYPTDEEQAGIIDNVIVAAFEHPAVQGVTIWGLNNAYHWRDNAVMFYADGSLKPSGQAYINRVRGTYWTSEEGQTDAQGQFSRTVFRGRLRVSARANGVERSIEVTVGDTAENLVLTLEPATGPINEYGDWLDRHYFTSVDEFGQFADLDGDMVNNFAEFLVGSDPARKDITAGIRPVDSNGTTVTIRIPVRSAWASRIGLDARHSTDAPQILQNWSTLATTPQFVETSGDFDIYEVQLPMGATGVDFYQFDFPRDEGLN